MSDQQTRGGCGTVAGVISIVFGVILLFIASPVGIIPAIAFIGGGFRLLTGSGSL